MTASHHSLRDDYEVSCAELDFLVDNACSVEGVYGARMTGGGFGGCTVNLLERNSIDRLKVTGAKYAEQFGFEPDFYLFDASGGASELIAGT
jgi:galactokinase